MLKKLNQILLSANVVKQFKAELKNEQFVKFLNKNFPEILECVNFKQNTQWHIYDVLTHILNSVEQMNKQTKNLSYKDRRMLAYVMLFHDVGKPRSKTIDLKDGNVIDRFIGHNKISAEIAQHRLINFNFDEETQNKMILLIEEHDTFIPLRLGKPTNPYLRKLTDSVVLEEIDKFNKVGNGAELVNYLIKVGYADNKSQNPAMTENSLKLLKVYKQILNSLTSEENNQNIA